MKRHILRLASIAFGSLLIVAGIIGLVLPLIPGLLLILAGLVVILGEEGARLLVVRWKKGALYFFTRRPGR